MQVEEGIIWTQAVPTSLVWAIFYNNEYYGVPSKPRGPHSLYQTYKNKVTALLVYVDDIVVTGNDEAEQ